MLVLKGGTIPKPKTEYCLTLGTAVTDLLQDFHTNTLFIQIEGHEPVYVGSRTL